MGRYTIDLDDREKRKVQVAMNAKDANGRTKMAYEAILERRGIEGAHGPYEIVLDFVNNRTRLRYFT